MRIKFRAAKQGPHVRVNVYMTEGEGETFQQNGQLVFSEEQWMHFRDTLIGNKLGEVALMNVAML